MKKILANIVAVSAFLLLATSCAKQEQAQLTGKGRTFTAVIEQSISKTALTRDLNVNWKAGDRISINGAEYSAIPKESATMALFQPVGKEAVKDVKGGYTAIYPASLWTEDGSWWLPRMQKYEPGCLNAPMFAQSSTEKLHFKNICGVLRISLTGTCKVNTIAVKANGDNVWGSFGVIDDELVLYGGGDEAVTLDCGEDGVQLNSNEATDFFIYLPPKHFAPGMTISVLTSDGSQFKKTIVKEIDINRNTVYPIGWNLIPSVEEALSKFFTDFAADQAQLTATTDEAIFRSNKLFGNRGIQSSLPEIHTWENAYSAIASLDNALIMLEAKETKTKEDDIQAAQLLFFRSYMYFEIFRTYGKGYICSEDSNTIFESSELAKYIVEYLKRALESLPPSYEEGERVFELENGIEVTYPTRFAALALLSRTYLYWCSPLFGGDPSMLPEVVNCCKEIINNGTKHLAADYSDLWGKNAFDNNELIFGVRFQDNDTYEGIYPLQSLIDQYDCGGEIFGKTWPEENVILPKDYRGVIEKRFLYSIEESHFTLKKDVSHVMPIFRFAGILLDCTEAQFLRGDSQPEYINMIRARAGLSSLPPGFTREQLEHERYIELAFEGYRFWDVRRWMKAKDYFIDICDSSIEEGDENYTLHRLYGQRPWDDSYYFFPIPGSTDIDLK